MNIPVFFTSKMVAEFEDMSPSAGKPVKVVESWQKLNIPLEIIEPTAATIQEISLAHDPKYVEDRGSHMPSMTNTHSWAAIIIRNGLSACLSGRCLTVTGILN